MRVGSMLPNKTYSLYDVKKWPVELEAAPGVYELVALDDSGNPLPLSRIGGTDKRGVLYIGQGGKIFKRLRLLSRGLFQGGRGHIAGRTYISREVVQTIAPANDLGFRFEHCEDCKGREKELIQEYIDQFGELPPLNAQS